MANGYPVVLCHGLFGWGPGELGGFPYWGTGTSVPCPLPRREASVGPVSSAHDRACELAAQIRGGRVDYGEEHAKQAGHDRFGRSYPPEQALHPAWSADSPVHLVGHSLGGPTIWMLQHLLDVDFFGWGSSARWVKSVSSISGVLNGSTATYMMGANPETGLIDPRTIGDYLGRSIELCIRCTGDLFERWYDFDLDHWGIESQGPLERLIGRIAGTDMFRGKDNGTYTLTIQGQLEQNALCQTDPDTYYFSYVTEQTRAGFLTGHHYPEPAMNPYAISTASYMGRAEYEEPFYPGFSSADWWHNDGLVPVFSQQYPRIAGNHPVAGAIGMRTRFDRGGWYHELLDSVDHIDIVGLPPLGGVGTQKRFYTKLYERLASL